MLDKVINNILNKMQYKQCIINDLHKVNKYIELFATELCFYCKIKYLIKNKGKHIRSILALNHYYKYNNTSYSNNNKLYELLAIIEITHFASLLHDDVIDNNNVRRGVSSFNYLYGNKNSILIGDYLLIKIFNNLYNLINNYKEGQYIMNQFIKASIDTVYGAYLENSLNIIKYNNEIINNYIKIARLKTGSLFKFSCIIGSMLSNANFNNIKQSANFGILFGIIYQMQNDLNNYKHHNYKESEDYMQSNITFPIIVLQNFIDIKNPFYNKNQENFEKIKQLINTNNFKEISNNITKNYIKLLIHMINEFNINN